MFVQWYMGTLSVMFVLSHSPLANLDFKIISFFTRCKIKMAAASDAVPDNESPLLGLAELSQMSCRDFSEFKV